jgi:Fe2+ or Zn2+ uptake regulation protein
VGHFSDELLAAVHEELGERQAFTVSQIQVTAFGVCRDCRAVAGEDLA